MQQLRKVRRRHDADRGPSRSCQLQPFASMQSASEWHQRYLVPRKAAGQPHLRSAACDHQCHVLFHCRELRPAALTQCNRANRLHDAGAWAERHTPWPAQRQLRRLRLRSQAHPSHGTQRHELHDRPARTIPTSSAVLRELPVGEPLPGPLLLARVGAEHRVHRVL